MRLKLVGLGALALVGVVLAQEASRQAAVDTLAVLGIGVAAVLESGADGLEPGSREQLVPTVAAWVVSFRDDAIALGAERVPPEIRDALLGHVPGEILDRVRWRIDSELAITGQNLLQLGGVRAVTLDHVIVFADADEAADATLWAHELYHVMQYAEWGIDGFVDRYLADRSAVEHEAWEFRWAWMKATGRVPSA